MFDYNQLIEPGIFLLSSQNIKSCKKLGNRIEEWTLLCCDIIYNTINYDIIKMPRTIVFTVPVHNRKYFYNGSVILTLWVYFSLKLFKKIILKPFSVFNNFRHLAMLLLFVVYSSWVIAYCLRSLLSVSNTKIKYFIVKTTSF